MRETRFFLKQCCPGQNSHGLIPSPDFSKAHRPVVLGSVMSIHIASSMHRWTHERSRPTSRLEIACSGFFRFSIFFVEEGTHSEIFWSETKIIFNWGLSRCLKFSNRWGLGSDFSKSASTNDTLESSMAFTSLRCIERPVHVLFRSSHVLEIACSEFNAFFFFQRRERATSSLIGDTLL